MTSSGMGWGGLSNYAIASSLLWGGAGWPWTTGTPPSGPLAEICSLRVRGGPLHTLLFGSDHSYRAARRSPLSMHVVLELRLEVLALLFRLPARFGPELEEQEGHF